MCTVNSIKVAMQRGSNRCGRMGSVFCRRQACTRYAKNRTSVLLKVGFAAVLQNEFAAVLAQGNGDFPGVLAGLFFNVPGMYSWSDVDVYRAVPGQPVVSPQYRTCAADGYGNDRYPGFSSYRESAEVKGHQAWYATKGAFGKEHQCMSLL